MTKGAQALESSIEIPDEMLLGDELDFDAQTPDEAAATTEDSESEQPADEKPKDQEEFLSDAELSALGVERNSPEHRALENKFFPLWQDRLRRAGLTEREIRAKLEGEAKMAERLKALDETETKKDESQNNNEVQWVTWDDFKPQTRLSEIVSDDEERTFDRYVQERIEHAVKSVQRTSQQVAERNAEVERQNSAAKEFRTWAESVKDHPDMTDAKRGMILDFVEKPYAKAMFLDDPKGFIEQLELRTGLKVKPEQPQVAAQKPTASRAQAAGTSVTRTRPATTQAPTTKKVAGTYENLVANTVAEMFG